MIRRQWFPLKTRIFGPAPHPEELVGPRLPYTIPALELLAACVNFLVFEEPLRPARAVVMEIDALASPTVLVADRARSPTLMAIMSEVDRCVALV